MLRSVLICCALMAAAIVASSASCPPDWHQINDKCYWGSDFNIRWEHVADTCNAIHKGAVPVSIHDDVLNAQLTEKVMRKRWAWLGLYRASADAHWTWLDGSAVNFTLWYTRQPSEPGEACVFMDSGYRMWFDERCDTDDKNSLLCQAEVYQHSP